MTGISFRYPGMKTVAGTPNSRNHSGARAPLLSHATARPRHAGTSFESQAQHGGPAADIRARPAGTSQRNEPGSLPSRPGPATPANNWADIVPQAMRCEATACAGTPSRWHDGAVVVCVCLRQVAAGTGDRGWGGRAGSAAHKFPDEGA